MISLRGVGKTFSGGAGTTRVLTGIDLAIEAGEALCITGPSGSGKSTLLNIIGTLTRPSAGEYRLNGRETTTLGDVALSEIRRRHFGFIFQKFNLLWDASALENVVLPMRYSGVPRSLRTRRAAGALERVGLGHRQQHKAYQLSGGEQQRVAIARAIVNEPQVILADEPTGNLDVETGRVVMDLLYAFWKQGKGLLLITHNPHVAQRFPRILEVADGRIQKSSLAARAL